VAGQLSPSYRGFVGVSESRDGPVKLALAMGKAPSSEEVRYLDRGSVLA
jgi:hypothetical protein